MNISYGEAMRLVHPDINKDIINPAKKIEIIRMNKKSPETLYKWISKWKLLPQQVTQQKKMSGQMMKFVLEPNKIYVNQDIWVTHKKFKGKYKVLKTTNKRVYFKKDTVDETGKKYFNFTSIYTTTIKSK